MLQRLLCLILAFSLLIGLSACSDEKVPFQVQEITGEVSFQSAGTDIRGEITCLASGNVTLKIKEPESIKDIEFTYEDEKMNVALGETAFCSKNSDESPVFVLLDILSTLARSDIDIPSKGKSEVTLSSGERQYSVIIDCESKKLLSASWGDFSYKFE